MALIRMMMVMVMTHAILSWSNSEHHAVDSKAHIHMHMLTVIHSQAVIMGVEAALR